MTQTVYLPVRLALDGDAVVADVTVTEAGARAIVLRTASDDLDLVLYSAYVGHDELERAQVAEVLELGRKAPELSSRVVEVAPGAFTYGRRFALYDHLHRLQELVASRQGGRLSAEGVEQAVRSFDPAAV